jgi:hypothetical protein
MHSIKNISDRNKIDTQSRSDEYNRRKRLIIIFEVSMHLKVFLKLKNPKKLSLLGKKNQKKQKNPKNPGFFTFPTLPGWPRPRAPSPRAAGRASASGPAHRTSRSFPVQYPTE